MRLGLNLKTEYLFWPIAIFVLGVFVFPINANAQVPGDFNIPCQTRCSGSNNDRLNCNNISTSPSVNFNWTPSSSATRYEVYYKNTSLGNWTRILTTNSTSYSASVPLDSQNHYYIRAINGNTGDYKSCSNVNFPGSGDCLANQPYPGGDANYQGVEANCWRGSLTLTVIVNGYGQVTSSFGNCGPNSTCRVDLARDTQVSLTAQSLGGSTFTNWGGDCSGTNPQCSGTMSVSRTVTANFTGGPAPTPTPTPTPTVPIDTTPPSISSVRIRNITTNSAVVSWTTNEPANSQVEYCLTGNRCGTQTTLSTTLITSHSVNLTGLAPNTSYYVWIKSADAAGNLRTAGSYLFRTLLTNATPTPQATPTPTVTPTPTPTNNPVIISNVQVTNITRDSATITWDTDRPADSQVIACFARIFCARIIAQDPSLVTMHSLNISGLTPDRNYYIRVSSADDTNDRAYSSIISFPTALGLVISGVDVSIGQNSIGLVWDTNYPADSQLRVCRFPFFCLGNTIYDPNLISAHSLTMNGLSSGTRYYYQLTSTDASGYRARTSNIYFYTLP